VAATNPILHQAGVIAYRIQDGKVRVLLMTSRDTGRWIIPRGNIKPGVTPCRAAEQEAYEEAGVRGTILGSNPLGMYTYSKKLPSGEARAATVEVYLPAAKGFPSFFVLTEGRNPTAWSREEPWSFTHRISPNVLFPACRMRSSMQTARA
jgi:8-oxo-dGTP pyrophosphatase MutT (NUDIX family)